MQFSNCKDLIHKFARFKNGIIYSIVSTGILCCLFCVAYAALLPPTVDLNAGEEDITIYGTDASDSLILDHGVEVADINGDGKADLILSAQSADGPSNSRNSGGEVYVYYGKGTFAGTLDTAGIVGTAPDVTIYGASADDELGRNLRPMGDLNNDGIDDLILGSSQGGDGPGEARPGCGEFYIIYGSRTLPAVIDLANGDEDVIIYGSASGKWLSPYGSSAIGDLNGDGKDDLILGTLLGDGPLGARLEAGEAYVIYGSETLPHVIDLSLHQENVIIYGATANDHYSGGQPFTAGDVNGDGIDDLVIGAYGGDGPGDGRINAGEVYVIYGSSSLPATIDLANIDQDVTIYGASASDGLAHSVSLGDINGDGKKDIVLGCPHADGPSELRPNAGEVYIIFGSSTIPSIIDLNAPGPYSIIYGATSVDRLAYIGSIDTGDMNGDGKDDLIVGAPEADGPSNGRISSGEGYIFYGSSSFPAIIDLNSDSPDVCIYGATAGDGLSYQGALRLADVNGDGKQDLLLGAQKGDGPLEARVDSGEAYLIYGSASLSPTIDLATSGEDVIFYGATGISAEWLTTLNSMHAGDINNDGAEDIIIGTPRADGPGETRDYCGEAYVTLGTPSALPATVIKPDAKGNPKGHHYGMARVTIDYQSGDNDCNTTVVLTRNDTGINMPDLNKVANVQWHLSTDRTHWVAEVIFYYLDSEIAGLDESRLALYSAPTTNGPFQKVNNAVFDKDKNKVTISGLTGFSVFILKDEDPPAVGCFIKNIYESVSQNKFLSII